MEDETDGPNGDSWIYSIDVGEEERDSLIDICLGNLSSPPRHAPDDPGIGAEVIFCIHVENGGHGYGLWRRLTQLEVSETLFCLLAKYAYIERT